MISYPFQTDVHRPLSSEYQHRQNFTHDVADPSGFSQSPLSGLESTSNDDNRGNGNALPCHPMPPDSWGSVAHCTPKFDRFSHQRESSLSSLASTTGPPSPFASRAINIQIAVADSAVDGYSEMHSQDPGSTQGGSYYPLAKPPDAFTGPHHNVDGGFEMAYPATISGPGLKGHLDRSLLPALDLADCHTRSLPESVASSVAGDSPPTPSVGGEPADRLDQRRNADFGSNAPKLDRTMTDVYSDELYNPNFTITPTSPSRSHAMASPSNDIFSQRINAANNYHLSTATSRAKSPFRTGSPLAPPSARNTNYRGNLQCGSTSRASGSGTARCDIPLLPHQVEAGPEPETPKTISPKDAVLEFSEGDGDNSFPLFPQEPVNFSMEAFVKDTIDHDIDQTYLQANDTTAPATVVPLPSQMNAGLQVPRQHPFKPGAGFDTPPRLSSSGSSSVVSGAGTPPKAMRPSTTSADSGTYTCTYHGCTLRFETPSLLQKHKREGHRQAQGSVGARDLGMTSSLLNTQAGPHRCDRLNPSTGKPCGTVFSRPYDLTRHEDTIHNGRKQKVRCDLCTEEKTFSRADALTRHYRVCHPDLELPGKHRRRGGG